MYRVLSSQGCLEINEVSIPNPNLERSEASILRQCCKGAEPVPIGDEALESLPIRARGRVNPHEGVEGRGHVQ